MANFIQYRLTIDGRQLNSCDDLTEHLRLVKADSLLVVSINNTGLPSLKDFPHLKNLARLSLDNNQLRDGFQYLAECQNIHYISLCGNPITEVVDLAPLGKLANLFSLDLLHCPVRQSPGYRKRVFDLIPSLKYLDGVSKYDRHVYPVVPILYLDVLREDDDQWEAMDQADADINDLELALGVHVNQDGNEDDDGENEQQIVGNHGDGEQPVGNNGIDQALVDAYGFAVEYDGDDAMDTDGEGGAAEIEIDLDDYLGEEDDEDWADGVDDEYDDPDYFVTDDDVDDDDMNNADYGQEGLFLSTDADDFDFEYSNEYVPDPYFTTNQIIRREQAVKAWYNTNQEHTQRFVRGGEAYLGGFDSTCNHYECQHSLRRLGQHMLAFLYKHRVHSLNTLTGKISCIGRVHFMVYSMAVGEGYVALGGANGWLALFDVANDKTRVVQLDSREYNNGMCFIRHGDEVRLLVASNDSHVYTLRLPDLEVVCRLMMPYPCNDVQASRDGRKIAVVGDGPSVCISSVAEDFTLSPPLQLPAHGDLQDRRQYVTWSSDSRCVAAGCNGTNAQSVLVWDLDRPQDNPDSFPASDFSPTNPHLLLVAERDMLVHVIDVRTRARETISYLSRGIINGVCFSWEGDSIYTALASESLVRTPLYGVATLKDQCIEAVRRMEGRLRHRGREYWRVWRRLVRHRDPGPERTEQAVAGRRRRSVVAPLWSEDETSTDDDEMALDFEKRAHYACGRSCQDEMHNGPYTDRDLRPDRIFFDDLEGFPNSGILKRELFDVLLSECKNNPTHATFEYMDRFLEDKKWLEAAPEGMARMKWYLDVMDEETLRKVFPFEEMLPKDPKEMQDNALH